jgi:hypothetical protein
MSCSCTNQTAKTWDAGKKQPTLRERYVTHQNLSRDAIRWVKLEIQNALHEHNPGEAWYKVRLFQVKPIKHYLPASNASAKKDCAVYRRNGGYIARHFCLRWRGGVSKDRKWKQKKRPRQKGSSIRRPLSRYVNVMFWAIRSDPDRDPSILLV